MTFLLCFLWLVAGLFIGVWLGLKWSVLAVAVAVRDGKMDKIIAEYRAKHGGGDDATSKQN